MIMIKPKVKVPEATAIEEQQLMEFEQRPSPVEASNELQNDSIFKDQR